MKRYVMGTRGDGTSDIVSEDSYDDLPVLIAGAADAKDIWISRETPAKLGGDEVTDTLIHEPPSGGSVFRIVRFLPGDAGETIESALEMHDSISSVHVPTAEYLATAKHASMHRTDTLNYMVVVSGHLTALSENRDVVLGPGDMIVQQACMHGWRNDGDEPAILVATMLPAESPS